MQCGTRGATRTSVSSQQPSSSIVSCQEVVVLVLTDVAFIVGLATTAT